MVSIHKNGRSNKNFAKVEEDPSARKPQDDPTKEVILSPAGFAQGRRILAAAKKDP
jgi:hypothetical protein